MSQRGELGKIGQRRYSGLFFEEFLTELRGKKGIETYKEMADNDEIVFAMLFAIEMLMRQTSLTVEPASDSKVDKEAAEFVESCMNDMQYTWQETISEILTFIQYGWSYHEIVYKRRCGRTKDNRTSSKYDDGLIGWRKLPIRSQDTLYEWKYDEKTDDLLGMIQAAYPDYNPVFIPLDKALHFTTKSIKANPEGKSILRGAYRPWYFKKRIQEIEGIGIERNLAGFPVLTADTESIWDDDEESQKLYAAAEAIVTGIRMDSRMGVVMPSGWKLELLSTSGKGAVDTNAIIERYDKRIATTVLADFILLGQQAVGSFALSSDKTKLFSTAIGTYLDIICDVFNNQAIPRLIDMNGEHFKGITAYPEMKHGDIEDVDIQKLGAFIQQVVGCGALTPDEGLEDHMREVAKLPKRIDEWGTGANPPANNNSGAGNKPSVNPEEAEDDMDDEKNALEAKKALGREL